MIDEIRNALSKIEKLPRRKQEEIALLIEEDLSWDSAFEQSQDGLSILAKEAREEYQSGKTSEKDW